MDEEAGIQGGNDLIEAGILISGLLAYPESWINRRVETIELLSHEETRHRVSVDLSLPANPEFCPRTEEGILVPLAILSKQPRRHFDLRDEAGNSIPVLGRDQNSELTHVAALSAALDVIHDDLEEDLFHLLADRLWTVITEPPDFAFPAAESLLHEVSLGESPLKPLTTDERFLQLLGHLARGYVLFAVIQGHEPVRRVLKFGYGERFDFEQDKPDPWWSKDGIRQRWEQPDGRRFLIDVEMSSWAQSFHLEVAIPEELRAISATFFAEDTAGTLVPVGEPEIDVDRISLYARTEPEQLGVSGAYVELIPERSGQIWQGFAIGATVSLTLLSGAILGIDRDTSDAAVSILLVGAAFYSGLSATSGKHIVVRKVFSGTRKSTLWIAGAAVAGSLSLTLELSEHISSAAWLVWHGRSPRYPVAVPGRLAGRSVSYPQDKEEIVSKKNEISIKTSGAYRVRSGEARSERISPKAVPAPVARTPMPKGQVAKVRELHRKAR